jgi:hypothetical protein
MDPITLFATGVTLGVSTYFMAKDKIKGGK